MAQNNAKGGGPPTGLAGGDLGGTYPSPVVLGVDGYSITPIQDGYLYFNGTGLVWSGVAAGSSFTAGGDLSGTNTSQTLIGIDGYSLPNPGNHLGVLQSSGTALTWNQGTAGQLLLENSTPLPTWTTLSGDSTITSGGVMKNTGLDGYSILPLPTTDGYLNYNPTSGTMQWSAISGGSSVTWANDLSTSSNTAQYVSALSGSNTSGVINLGTATSSVSLTNIAPSGATAGYGLTITGSQGATVASGSTVYAGGSISITTGQGGNITTGSFSNNAGTSGNLTLATGYGGVAANSTTTYSGGTGNVILQSGNVGPNSSYGSYSNSTGSVTIQTGSNSSSVSSGGVGSLNLLVGQQGTTPGSYLTSASINIGTASTTYSSGGLGNNYGPVNIWTAPVTSDNSPGFSGSINLNTGYNNGSRLANIGTGNINLTTGNQTGVGGTNPSGNVVLATGSSASGTPGSVLLQPNLTTVFSAISKQAQFAASVQYHTASKTSAYTVALGDFLVFTDSTSAAFTVTLPSAPSTGDTYRVKDSTGQSATNNVTISGNGKNIDGSSTYVLNLAYAMVELTYNGSQWSVVGSYNGTVI